MRPATLRHWAMLRPWRRTHGYDATALPAPCYCPPRSMPLPSPLDMAGSGRIWSQGFPHPARLASALRCLEVGEVPAPRRAGTRAATRPSAAATSASLPQDRW